MTSRAVRALVYYRLPLWLDILTHGFLPGQGDGIPSGNRPGSRLPLPDWALDLSRAFAALNPATATIPDEHLLARLPVAPLNDAQRVIWVYYHPALRAVPPDMTRANRQQWQHDRDRETRRAVKSHHDQRDAVVAAHLGLGTRQVEELRQGAVATFATLLHWDRDAPD